VFLSSTAATYGRRGAPIYGASKAALNSLIEAEAERLAAQGILVSAVAPAKVATKLQECLNPGTPRTQMIDPAYIAKVVLDTLATFAYGDIRFIRKGEDL
jgi:NAD(P)-dependent dehydrogenase (short-subunit alcohol dehydrogenase family)